MRNFILVSCLIFSNIVTASTVTWLWESRRGLGLDPREGGLEQGEFITTEADNSGFYELLDFKLLKSVTNPHLEGGSISGGEFETQGFVFTDGDFNAPTGEIRTGIRLHLRVIDTGIFFRPVEDLFTPHDNEPRWTIRSKVNNSERYEFSFIDDGDNEIVVTTGNPGKSFIAFLNVTQVPVPGTFWLLATGLFAIKSMKHSKKSRF